VEGALGQAASVAALLDAPHRHLVRSIICLAGQPDFAEVTDSGVEVLGIDKVVGRVAALPAVLDQQTVVGLYSLLGQQLTQPRPAPAPHFRGTAAGNPAPRPYQGTGYPSPVPARARNWPLSTPPPRASQPRKVQSRRVQLAGGIWSLLLLGMVVFSLTAPLWSR
jgi:hypothetical protein